MTASDRQETALNAEREFQQQVEKELQSLYLQDTSPVAALRVKAGARTTSSLAWLGPMALVFVVVVTGFLVLPTVDTIIRQGGGLVLLIVVPVLLLLLSRWLGKKSKEQQDMQRHQLLHVLNELQQLEPDEPEWLGKQERIQQHHKLSINEEADMFERWEQAGLRNAAALLEREDVRDLLCPELQHIASRDVFRISRAATPVLRECIADGKLDMPGVPVLFAAVAMQIYRRGIPALCGATPVAQDTTAEPVSGQSDSA